MASNTLESAISPLATAKKVHRYSHASYLDMVNLFKNAGRLTDELDKALKK